MNRDVYELIDQLIETGIEAMLVQDTPDAKACDVGYLGGVWRTGDSVVVEMLQATDADIKAVRSTPLNPYCVTLRDRRDNQYRWEWPLFTYELVATEARRTINVKLGPLAVLA